MTFVSSLSSYPDVTPQELSPVTFVLSVSSYPDATPKELSASDICIICF